MAVLSAMMVASWYTLSLNSKKGFAGTVLRLKRTCVVKKRVVEINEVIQR